MNNPSAVINHQNGNISLDLKYSHLTNLTQIQTSWWFQAIWKIIVKLDHFPKVWAENKNIFETP